MVLSLIIFSGKALLIISYNNRSKSLGIAFRSRIFIISRVVSFLQISYLNLVMFFYILVAFVSRIFIALEYAS